MKQKHTTIFTKFAGLIGLVGGMLFGNAQQAEAITLPVQPVQAKTVQFQLPGLGVGAQRDSVFQASKSPYLVLEYKARVDLDTATPQEQNVAKKKAPRGYTATTYHLTAENKRLAGIIKKHELDIPYPYLDVKGNPTVGRGIASFNVKDFQDLPFCTYDAKTGKLTNHPASKKQIAQNYYALKKCKYGKGIYAYTFRHATNIGLSQGAIEQTYKDEMDVVIAKLEEDVPNFEYMPTAGQIALADMSWQTGRITPYHQVKDAHGHTHYKRAWKTFTYALNQGNIAFAAKHSHRPDAGGVRNHDTKLLFAEAQHIIKAERVRLAAAENQDMLVKTTNNTVTNNPVSMFSTPTVTNSAPVFTSQLVDLRQ